VITIARGPLPVTIGLPGRFVARVIGVTVLPMLFTT